MGIKFFGQFLIERKRIDATQLRAALDMMSVENRSLGELAVLEDCMSVQDAGKVNDEQRRRDRPFGELAVEMGLMTEEQLDSLVRIQSESRLRMGQALIRLEVLEPSELPGLLEEFDRDQADYRLESSPLRGPLGSHPVASVVLELIPKMLTRVAHMEACVGQGEDFAGLEPMDNCVAIAVRGKPGLRMTLMGDREFAMRVASEAANLEPELLDDEMVGDGVGEFLNILAGNCAALLENRDVSIELEPPVVGVVPQAGTRFDLAVGIGTATLVLESLE